MSWLLHEGPTALSGSALVVALVLAEHANGETGVAYPSVSRIAGMSRISDRQVTRILASLVEQGVVEVAWEATNRRPTAYRFCQFRGDIRVTPRKEPGVTAGAARGDTGVEAGVTPTSPKRNDGNANDENVPPPAPPKGGRDRRRTMPKDWQITDELRAYAVTAGIPATEVDAFAEEFKFFWLGDGGRKLDWNATFQGRCRDQAWRFRPRNGRDVNATIIQPGAVEVETPEQREERERKRREHLAMLAEKDGTPEERWQRKNRDQAEARVKEAG